jgi:hypothetical protein
VLEKQTPHQRPLCIKKQTKIKSQNGSSKKLQYFTSSEQRYFILSARNLHVFKAAKQI